MEPTATPDAVGAAPVAPRRVRVVALAGVGTVLAYVGAWAFGGILWGGYDPARQAISELFAIGAPPATRLPLSIGLVASGAGLVAFGWAMDVALPGRGRAGPVLAALSGVMTVAVVAFPCSAGCPGFGTSATDTLHVLTAGTGYAALILTPLVVGWRVRHDLAGFARASWAVGGLALVLFLVATLAVVPGWSGLQQRLYNTTADLWYVMAAVVVLRRTPPGRRGAA